MEVLLKFALEATGLLGRREIIDHGDSIGKEHGVAFQASGVAQGCGQMGFSDADRAKEDDVGLLGDELQSKEVLDLEPIDFSGKIPIELFQGFDERETSGFDSALNGGLTALV